MTGPVAAEVVGVAVAVGVYIAAVRGALGYRWSGQGRAAAAALLAGASVVTFGPGLVAAVRAQGLLVVAVWVTLIVGLAYTAYERLLFRNRVLAYAAAAFVALLVFAPRWAANLTNTTVAVLVPYLGLIVVGALALRFARR